MKKYLVFVILVMLYAPCALANNLRTARSQFSEGDIPSAATTLGKLLYPKPRVQGKDLEETKKLFGICKYLLGDKNTAKSIFSEVLARNPQAHLNSEDILDPQLPGFFEKQRKRKSVPLAQEKIPQQRTALANQNKQKSGIFINCSVPQAGVFANGIFVGVCGQFITLASGFYKVTVVADGHKSETRMVNVQPHQKASLEVSLKSENGQSAHVLQSPQPVAIPKKSTTSPRPVAQPNYTNPTGDPENYDSDQEISAPQNKTASAKGNKNIFIAAAPFGLGQFQNKETTKGGIIGATQLVSLYFWYDRGNQVSSYKKILAEDDGTDPGYTSQATDYLKNLQLQQNIGLLLFAAAWAYGAYDGVTRMKATPTWNLGFSTNGRVNLNVSYNF